MGFWCSFSLVVQGNNCRCKGLVPNCYGAVFADGSRSLQPVLRKFAVCIFHVSAILTTCSALKAPAVGITGVGANGSN